ncbi:bacteriocin-like protein [Orenia metallireducens]|uniref:Bacteriocin-type signal sequence-containing protein n=1 Tax=Orenia metallireducens TaxID=1413210 RepID=A0A285IIN1_9FIRM|nr:hypothetical protein [Orenia metallireducens]PRX18141.1 bacteriocin-like protein [Orenia metallireducens]SNY46936.1 bacteriocin-type signal sequence-containing protein [Orenia metallireducens]
MANIKEKKLSIEELEEITGGFKMSPEENGKQLDHYYIPGMKYGVVFVPHNDEVSYPFLGTKYGARTKR